MIVVEHAGHEVDLYGTYRRGFADITSFALKDYRIHYEPELASRGVELLLSVKGVRKYENESNTAAMNQLQA